MKKISFITLVSFTFSIIFPAISPLNAGSSYPIDSSFVTDVIETNQVGQAEVKASITIQLGSPAGNLPFDPQMTCVNADPSPSPSVYIKYSVIVGSYFLNFTSCANIAQKGSTFLQIHKYNYPTLTTNSNADMIATLVGFGDINGDLAISSPGANQITFTRIGTEPGGNIAYFDSTPSYGMLPAVATVTGVPYVASQIATVDLIPDNVSPADTFEMTINGDVYSATGSTVSEVITNLLSVYNGSPSSGVSCTDNSTKITCTGANDGVSITASSRVIYAGPDMIAPEISFVGNSTIHHEYGSAFNDPGVSWIDNRDGSGIEYAYSGTVDINTLGMYTLQYMVTDTANNTSSGLTRTVTVEDTTAPMLTLSGNNTITVEIDDGYSDDGATWTDLYDGSGIVYADSYEITNTGAKMLMYHYTDASGNIGSMARMLNVVDTIAPILTLNTTSTTVDANIFPITGNIGGYGSVAISGGASSVNLSNVNGSFTAYVPLTQNVANTLVITVTDLGGNTTTGSLTITESGSTNGFSGAVNVSGNSLSGVTSFSGASLTGTTQLVVQAPIYFGGIGGAGYIPSSTVITSASGGSNVFDATAINTLNVTVTGGLDSNQTAVNALEFGISNIGLHFSKPVKIQIPVAGYTGATIPVKVKHGGTSTFVTTGLTNNPNATCTNGVSSSPSSVATVSSNIATIYTCAASTFVTYTESVVVSSGNNGGGGGGSSYVPVATTTTVATTSVPSVVPTVSSVGSMSFVVDLKAFRSSKVIKTKSTEKNGTRIFVSRILPNGKSRLIGTTRVIRGEIRYRIPGQGKYAFSLTK